MANANVKMNIQEFVVLQQGVTKQMANVAYVSLDTLEASANQSASAAIILRKMYVTRQLVNADYVNLVLVDTSAQVNNGSLWK